ncbi:MAG: protein kinase [Planctomycetota bacterium]
MFRTSALLSLAREHELMPTAELGRLLRAWQVAGEALPFETWAAQTGVLPQPVARALRDAMRDAAFRCMSCLRSFCGGQLVGVAHLYCPFCNSAALKREGTPAAARIDSELTPPSDTGGDTPTATPGADDDATRILADAPPTPVGTHDATPPSGSLGVVERSGQWVILRKVGEGGMATVWHAYNHAIDRFAAVKVLELTEPEVTERFRREALACGRLDHPNVVGVTDVGTVWGKPCIVMDWVDGGSLDHHLRHDSLMSVASILDIGIQAALGLQAAHSAGIVHRDIKPANLLQARRDGRVRVSDFGLALVRDEANRLTRSGTVMGTTLYMSPEQANGIDVGPASDIYSLAATLFHLLTGSPPFVGGGASVLHQHLTAPFPRARQRRPEVPDALDALLHQMSAKRPADRPTSMAVVGDRLQMILRKHLTVSLPAILGPTSDDTSDVPLLPSGEASALNDVVLVEVPARPDSRFWLETELVVDELRDSGARIIVLDLSACESLQSAGVATLISMREQAAHEGIRVVVAAPGDRDDLAAELIGSSPELPVTHDINEVIRLLGGDRVRRMRPLDARSARTPPCMVAGQPLTSQVND